MESVHFRHQTEVTFGDTDASGWMHFPNIFQYVERAEHAFLKSLGVVTYERSQGGWPRVHVACDYKKPLLGGDQIEVSLAITRVGESSLTWEFEISTCDGHVAAVGQMVTVRVNHEGKKQAISDQERIALTI